MDRVGNLLDVLRKHRVTLEEDSVFWKEGRDGLFRVKKAYNVLASPIVTVFLKNNIWVDKVPTKIAFLLGKPHGGRSSLLIGFREEGGSFLTVVSCVGVKRKRLIIF